MSLRGPEEACGSRLAARDGRADDRPIAGTWHQPFDNVKPRAWSPRDQLRAAEAKTGSLIASLHTLWASHHERSRDLAEKARRRTGQHSRMDGGKQAKKR